jgi:cell fate regulator YaaT (PSP1 superfamily)
MGCSTCGTVTNGKVGGCGSGGGCSTGGCNRLNVYDWFADLPISFSEKVFNVVEISFKYGARKGYFRNANYLELMKGDLVVVDTGTGFDIGEVSLKGELVKLQLKKNNIKDRSDTIKNILRKANPKDREKLAELRALENEYMVKARVISRELDLNMKLGDVEMQGDGTKATFFYTAEDRVDFRELVRRYAKDFKVKIEMRQIGARQEAGRIGGIGSCGRELCCSTWLTDFKTVNTTMARYQQLSINTDKLSGQCGRLKCCLNYELDSYLDALKDFPKEINELHTKDATAKLIKTEILTKTLWFKFPGSERIFKLHVKEAVEIQKMNKNGIRPESLGEYAAPEKVKEEHQYEELVGHVTLNTLEKKQGNRSKNNRNKGNNRGGAEGGQANAGNRNQGPNNRQGGPNRNQNNPPKDAAAKPANQPQQGNQQGAGQNRNQGNAPKGDGNKGNNAPNQGRQQGGNRPPQNRPPQAPNPNQQAGANQAAPANQPPAPNQNKGNHTPRRDNRGK